METNDCILLKRSEYQELLTKANAAKPDTIRVTYYFNISGYSSYSPPISGSIELSGKLKDQIDRIIGNLRMEFYNINVKERESQKQHLINGFKNLSLLDRIFFKEDKI